MSWPERGVYFLFEPGEVRTNRPTIDRVVRVGTHALKENSRTTLWKRLSQHRGTTRSGGGNHRGSIFRLLVGEALMRRDQSLHIRSWGSGSTASRETRHGEREHEARVSDYLGDFALLCLPISDTPGPTSLRGLIERNCIALLSNYVEPGPDLPQERWLGHFSGRDRVRRSGLWNNNHVDERYNPSFLKLFGELVTSI
jgi:hypothetical protein